MRSGDMGVSAWILRRVNGSGAMALLSTYGPLLILAAIME
jgi:hypothetical protein